MARVRALLDKYPRLMGELSYRPGLTHGGGGLSPEWKALLTEQPDRFLIGSDTWVNPRWGSYDLLMAEARSLGFTRLSLETGAQAAFQPARTLYARAGFVECRPFQGYALDPNSVFMTRPLA